MSRRDERYSDVFVEVLDLTDLKETVSEGIQQRCPGQEVVGVFTQTYGRVETAEGLVILVDDVLYGPLPEEEPFTIEFFAIWACTEDDIPVAQDFLRSSNTEIGVALSDVAIPVAKVCHDPEALLPLTPDELRSLPVKTVQSLADFMGEV